MERLEKIHKTQLDEDLIGEPEIREQQYIKYVNKHAGQNLKSFISVP
jgi:hypothetical protein